MKQETTKGLALSPKKFGFIIKRINGDDIKITQQERDNIIKIIDKVKFIKVRDYFIATSSIQSIEPNLSIFEKMVANPPSY